MFSWLVKRWLSLWTDGKMEGVGREGGEGGSGGLTLLLCEGRGSFGGRVVLTGMILR